jgi:hypothetical protein
VNAVAAMGAASGTANARVGASLLPGEGVVPVREAGWYVQAPAGKGVQATTDWGVWDWT